MILMFNILFVQIGSPVSGMNVSKAETSAGTLSAPSGILLTIVQGPDPVIVFTHYIYYRGDNFCIQAK